MVNVCAMDSSLPSTHAEPQRDLQSVDCNAETSERDCQDSPSQIPRITIEDSEQNYIEYRSDNSATQAAMSSHRSSHSHHSHHSSSSSSSNGKGNGKSKKDDWSKITDPEERRRVQNRIAQRKFRDKAKEAKEQQDRDADNRAHAGHSYNTPDPRELGHDDELSGLPWGSLSLKHVVSKGHAREEESRRGSRKGDDRRSYYDTGEQGPAYGGGTYCEGDRTYYEPDDRPHYDYRSGGSGHGGSSR